MFWVAPLRKDVGVQIGKACSEADQLLRLLRAKASAGRQITDRFEKVRLSLRIFAQNQVDAGVQREVQRFIVPEVKQAQPRQLHTSSCETSQVFPIKVTVSPGWSFLPRWVQVSPFTCTCPF